MGGLEAKRSQVNKSSMDGRPTIGGSSCSNPKRIKLKLLTKIKFQQPINYVMKLIRSLKGCNTLGQCKDYDVDNKA